MVASRKAGIIFLAILLLAAGSAMAANTPINVTGWNQDCVIEANAATAAGAAVQFGAGGDNTTWFESGYQGHADGFISGPFTSLFDPATTYQFQPFSGAGGALQNNVLRIAPSAQGTLTLVKPVCIRTLRILASSTSSTVTTVGTYFLTFSDNTTTTVKNFNNFDWGSNGINKAVTNLGRWNLNGDTYNHPVNFSLFETQDAPLTTKLVTSISFNAPTINGNTGIFALSGEVVDVVSLTPANGQPNTATPITINGNGFQPGATVTIGGALCTNVVIQSNTVITCSSPSLPSGTYDVTVNNSEGSFGTLAQGFTAALSPPPTVTGVTPASGTSAGGTPITIAGQNFRPGATVQFGPANGMTAVTVTAASVVVNGAGTQLTLNTPAVAPALADGPTSVLVTNSDATNFTLNNAFTYIGPTPAVTQVTPNSGPFNLPTVVQLTGTNFASNFANGGTVKAGGQLCTNVVRTSATQINCTIPKLAGAIATVDVVVTNPDGVSGTATAAFTYQPRPPDNPTATQQGMFRRYYQANGTPSLPDFTTVQPFSTAIQTSLQPFVAMATSTNQFDATRPDNWSCQWTGYVNIPTSAVWTFYTNSDDGSRLFIGSTMVVDSNFAQGATERGAPIPLTAGKHFLKVQYAENTGGIVCNVRYSSATVNKTDIPDSELSVDATPTITSITPNHGPTSGGTNVTIKGTGFGSIGAFGDNPIFQAVLINGVVPTNLVKVDATTIMCTTPASVSSGAATIALQTVSGPAATLTLPANDPAGFTYDSGSLTWKGTVDSKWSTPGNWVENRAPLPGDVLILTQGPNLPTTMDVANLSIFSLTFNAAATTPITINLGGTATSLGFAGNGAFITVNGADHTIDAPISLLSATAINVPANRAFTLSGLVSGAVANGLNFNGPGKLTLSGVASMYLGATSANGGTLSIASVADAGQPSSIGAAAVASANIQLNGNAILQFTGTTGSTNRGMTLGAGNNTIDVGANSLTIGGVVTGAGKLIKLGTGTLTLSNAGNNYVDGTTVNAGKLASSGGGTLGTGLLTLNNGTTLVLGSVNTKSYRYYKFQQTALRGPAPNSIQLSEFQVLAQGNRIPAVAVTNPVGTFPLNNGVQNPVGETPPNANDNSTGTKWLDFTRGPLIYDMGSSIVIDAYRFATANDAQERDPVSWDFSGSNDNSNYTLINQQANFPTPTARFTFTPDIQLGAASPTYANNIQINGNCIIEIVATVALPTFTMGNLEMGANTSITLNTNALTAVDQAYGLKFVGGNTIGAAPKFTINNNGAGLATLTLGSLTDGATARTITKDGTGTLVVSGPALSLVNGTALNVAGGELSLGDAGALGTFAKVDLATGTKMSLTAAGATTTLGMLTGSGGTVLNGNTLSVGTPGTTVNGSYSGAITEGTPPGGGVIKDGLGIWLLGQAVNNYTGSTTVNAGTLTVNGLLGATSGVSVLTGATLRGNGIINGDVNLDGTIFPGDALFAAKGTLTIKGLNANLSSVVRIRGTASTVGSVTTDQLVITGTSVNINSGATLSLGFNIKSGTYTPATNNTIINMTSGNILSTSFTKITVTNQAAGQPAIAGVKINYVDASNATQVSVTIPGNGQFTTGGAPVAPPVNRLILNLSGNVTPATLASFDARAEGAGALVEWTLASEFKNAGFNLYRRLVANENSAWTKANPALIAGRISEPGAKTYRFYDWAPAGVYEYRLESVESGMGLGEFHATLSSPVVVCDRLETVSLEALAAAFSGAAEQANSARGAALLAAGLETRDARLETRDARLETRDARLETRDARYENRGASRLEMRDTRAEKREASVAKATSSLESRISSLNAEVREIAAASPRSAYAPEASNSGTLSLPGVLPRAIPRPSRGASSTNVAKVVYDKEGVLLVPRSSLPAGFNASRLRIQREGRTVNALAVTDAGVLLYAPGYSDDYTNKDAFFFSSSTTPTPAGAPTRAQGLFGPGVSVTTATGASSAMQFRDVYFDWDLRPYDYPPYFSRQYLTQGRWDPLESTCRHASLSIL